MKARNGNKEGRKKRWKEEEKKIAGREEKYAQKITGGEKERRKWESKRDGGKE